MRYIITANSVIIITADVRVEFVKASFSQDILMHPILENLSMHDLKTIWDDLYGIPKTIKDILRKKTQIYRKSLDVRAFLHKGKNYWISKEDRASLWTICNSVVGNVDLVVGNEVLNMSALQLKSFLLKLENHAYKCYVNENKHLQCIEKLSTPEEMINYDYTTGYPEKITLE